MFVSETPSSGFFPLDECHSDGTTFSDISANKLIGETVGVRYELGPKGNPSGAAMFSGGANSYANIPQSVGLDAKKSITISAHIYPMEFSNCPLVYYSDEDDVGVNLQLYNQGLAFRVVQRSANTGLGETITSDGLVLNAWNYIAVTFDYESGVAKIYHNSTMVAEFTVGQREIATNGNIRIGAVSGISTYYKGKMACLKVFSKALTDQEVTDDASCEICK